MALSSNGQDAGLSNREHGFNSRRGHQIELWCSMANIPLSDGGDRWFESSQLDQYASVAQRKSSGLQNRQLEVRILPLVPGDKMT